MFHVSVGTWVDGREEGEALSPSTFREGKSRTVDSGIIRCVGLGEGEDVDGQDSLTWDSEGGREEAGENDDEVEEDSGRRGREGRMEGARRLRVVCLRWKDGEICPVCLELSRWSAMRT